VDNAALKAKVAGLRLGATEFRQVDIGSGIKLNAWFIKPPNFDSHVPVSGALLCLWRAGLANRHGRLGRAELFLVPDAGAARVHRGQRRQSRHGRARPPVAQADLSADGVVETQDQAAAARTVGRLPYVDSTRIGIWG